MVYENKIAHGSAIFYTTKAEQGNHRAHGRTVAACAHECIGAGKHGMFGGGGVSRVGHQDLGAVPAARLGVAQYRDVGGRGLDVREMFHEKEQ